MNVSKLKPNIILQMTALGLLSVSLSCAHSQMNESVDKKLQSAPSITTSQQLGAHAEAMINGSQTLNDKQRGQLMDLYRRTHEQLLAVSDDSLRLRELLISEIAQPKYNDDEVSVIKDRLKNAEDKKLSLIFGAVDDANKILGHNPDRNREILRVFSSLPVEAL